MVHCSVLVAVMVKFMQFLCHAIKACLRHYVGEKINIQAGAQRKEQTWGRF
jgi:hypothetical protein